MKNKNNYTIKERIALIEKYRKQGYGCTGTEEGLRWYMSGLKYAQEGHEYDHKNYLFYYDIGRHNREYERKGYRLFKKATECFRKSAELGNDLAIMNYALYLYAFKEQEAEALALFEKASDLGLAVSDYQLYTFYKKGCCDLKVDDGKAAFYLGRFQKRIAEDERQFILAWGVELNTGTLGRSFMFSWFHGFTFHEMYDTPSAKPSKWKYKHYRFLTKIKSI